MKVTAHRHNWQEISKLEEKAKGKKLKHDKTLENAIMDMVRDVDGWKGNPTHLEVQKESRDERKTSDI